MRGVVGTDHIYVSYSGTGTMVPELSVAVILTLRDIEGHVSVTIRAFIKSWTGG